MANIHTEKDVEHISVNYPLKLRLLSHHGESLHKQLVELKHCLFDLQNGDMTDALAVDEVGSEVMPLLNEIEYLKNVVEALHEEKNDAMFSHFVENVAAYAEHVEDNLGGRKLVKRLKEQEHLLRTLYHKEELEHDIDEMAAKFGDSAGKAMHHFTEAHTKGHWLFGKTKSVHSEKLEMIELLGDRAVKLGNAAKWMCEKLIKQKIRQMDRKIRHGKKESARLLHEGKKHYNKVSKLHDRLLS